MPESRSETCCKTSGENLQFMEHVMHTVPDTLSQQVRLLSWLNQNQVHVTEDVCSLNQRNVRHVRMTRDRLYLDVKVFPVIDRVAQSASIQLDLLAAAFAIAEDVIKHDYIFYSTCHDSCNVTAM